MPKRKNRKKNEIVRDMSPLFILSGAGIGTSLLGSSLQGKIPAGIFNPLTSTGSTIGVFIPPVATITATGVTLKQLKKLKKKMKGGKEINGRKKS